MIELPSMLVIDFCEWLKGRVNRGGDEQDGDILELVLNYEYRSRLTEYAHEYLCSGGSILQRLLHSFIDSKEFQDCIRHGYPFLWDGWRHMQRNGWKDYRFLFEEFHHSLHCRECEGAFDRFIMRLSENNGFNKIEGTINAERLADSARVVLTHSEEPLVLGFMLKADSSLSREIDFLEWLLINKNKPMDLKQMPLKVFSNLVDEFYESEGKYSKGGKYSDEKKKLIKAFKQTDPDALARKLLAVLSDSKSKRMKSLGYIYDRYSSGKIPYKCLFLPLAAEADSFQKFIEDYWVDLNSLSGDFLDIYYSREDFGKSGYELRDSIASLPSGLSNDLPCIVLWGNNTGKARTIDTMGLANADIFRLLSSIVDLIKAKRPFDLIIERGNKMAKDLREQYRPAITVHNAVDKNYGVVAGISENSNITTGINEPIDKKGFSYDVSEAIIFIRNHNETSEEQKEALIKIIKEAESAVNNDADDEKSQSKAKFKYFMLGAGNAVKNLLTVFSSLANLARFFDIRIP